MENIWSIETHGDPLGAVARFIEYVWRTAQLDALIVSSDTLGNGGQGAKVLESPDELSKVNPFRPAMRTNTARYIPAVVRERASQRVGALLRPCEARALDSVGRLDPFPHDLLLTIGVDCMGTYPEEELSWREARHTPAQVSDQTSGPQFTRQGGINMYRYRPACQVCKTPKAETCDVNIGVLGMPSRQTILVGTRQADKASALRFADFPVIAASPSLIIKRDQMLERIADRNAHTRARMLDGLAGLIPTNLEQLVVQFEACGDCQACLDACPTCSVKRPTRDPDGRFRRQDVAQWLSACAGCGMCEQACGRDLPLSVIFGLIREQLRAPVKLH